MPPDAKARISGKPQTVQPVQKIKTK